METIFCFLGMLFAALILAAVIQTYLFQIVRVKGGSMKNTLQSGEAVLAVKWGGYRRGDVVLCHYPRRSQWNGTFAGILTVTWKTLFVKRLVALPGDTVEIAEGCLYVNGELVPDPLTLGSSPRDYPPRTLGRDEYFVIGDNRASSHDSRARNVGPIAKTMLQGRVKCVLWSPKNFRIVR